MPDYKEEQRRIAQIALDASTGGQFALAGSGAVREHGLIDRPTEDIDLFTIQQAAPQFETAVNRAITSLEAHGYLVEEKQHNPGFVRMAVTDRASGYETDIDFGIDWRSAPPVVLSIGPVLSRADAVGNKVSALFSRAEIRDYLDFDAIRRHGPYSDQELLELAAKADPGFDIDMFRRTLERVRFISSEEVREYGVTEQDLDDVKKRLSIFAEDLRMGSISKDKSHSAPASGIGVPVKPMNAGGHNQEKLHTIRHRHR